MDPRAGIRLHYTVWYISRQNKIKDKCNFRVTGRCTGASNCGSSELGPDPLILQAQKAGARAHGVPMGFSPPSEDHDGAPGSFTELRLALWVSGVGF